MDRIRPVLEKKALLGVDSWGGLDNEIRHFMSPLEATFREHFPDYNPFPFGAQWQINRIVRNILLAEPLLDQLGVLLHGLTERDIDELMRSFHFDHCAQDGAVRNHIEFIGYSTRGKMPANPGRGFLSQRKTSYSTPTPAEEQHPELGPDASRLRSYLRARAP
jgi:hypothetical protein